MTRIQWAVIAVLVWLVCPAKVPFFSQMPDHSDAFIPFDLSLKTPLWSKLGSCIHSYFHFLIAVELANSNCDCDSHQSLPPIMLHPKASILYKDSQCNNHHYHHHHHYRSTPLLSSAAFFAAPHSYTSINRLWFKRGNMCGPFNFGPKPSFQCNCHCTSTYFLNSIWILHHLLHVTCATIAASINQELQSPCDWTCCTVMNTTSQ